MDEVVKQAMAKWPNVPHCYGWLALDARGAWRMRDDRAQVQGLAGDRIVHRALLDFINRNYTHDDQGRWYFQNGPQRVYVDLALAPNVVRTDAAQEFVLHTGQAFGKIRAAWLSADGELLLQNDTHLAALDDRDLAQCLPLLTLGDEGSHSKQHSEPPSREHSEEAIGDEGLADDALLAWLSDSSDRTPLYLRLPSGAVRVNRLAYPLRDPQFEKDFGVVRCPRSDQVSDPGSDPSLAADPEANPVINPVSGREH